MDVEQRIDNQGSGNIFVQNTGSHVAINVAGQPYLTLIPARARIQSAPLNSEIDLLSPYRLSAERNGALQSALKQKARTACGLDFVMLGS